MIEDRDTCFDNLALVVILIGTNDSTTEGSDQSLSVGEYKTHLKTIITACKQFTENVLLLAPPPISVAQWTTHCEKEGKPMQRSEERAASFARACQEVAVESGLACLDLFDIFVQEVSSVCALMCSSRKICTYALC